MFVVDGSENSKFYRSKTKVINILKPFVPNSFTHQLKIYFIQFGGTDDFKTDLKKYTICSQTNKTACDTFNEFKVKILKVKKLKGEPYWNDAFKGLDTLQMRPGSTKILLTITGDKIKNEDEFINWNIVDDLKRLLFKE